MQEQKKTAPKLTLRKKDVRELSGDQLRQIVGCGHISEFCSNATCTSTCCDYNTRFPP